MRTISLPEADAAAVRGSVEVVAQIRPADLTLPTPCAGWDLTALLAHMTAQHRGFAASAEGRGGDLAVWEPAVADDPVRAYADAAEAVITAFAAPDVPGRAFRLPEISTERTLPGRMAIGFHLVDYVVHGWDVARTLDVAYGPSPDVLALALPIARAVPGGEARRAPGAAFAPGLAVPAEADQLTEILLLLGRDVTSRESAWSGGTGGRPGR
jgi:uncharacterized protein (TIGR03086 family)